MKKSIAALVLATFALTACAGVDEDEWRYDLENSGAGTPSGTWDKYVEYFELLCERSGSMDGLPAYDREQTEIGVHHVCPDREDEVGDMDWGAYELIDDAIG